VKQRNNLRGQRPPLHQQNLLLGLLQRAWRFLTDACYRTELRMRFRPQDGEFQPYGRTAFDLYPRIFAFVQSQLGADARLNLLSFGCATGEEVSTLRRYFPAASIKGIDANSSSIAACRRHLGRHRDPNIVFETGNSTAAEPSDSYDAIFCMAVLRHGGLRDCTRCDHLIRFEDFARIIEGFRRYLKPGGLLVICHANFRLCDAPSGRHFESLLRADFPESARTPVFGPDNRLMKDVAYPDIVFRRTC